MKEQPRSVVVLTGAASGLGRQLALDLAAEGKALVLADLNDAGLRETERLIHQRCAGCPVLVHRTDITEETGCRALVQAALNRFQAVHLLVLCAGVSMWARFDQITDLAMFRKLIEVNYLGSVYCIHAALPALVESRGSIVAVSSLQGEVAIPNHSGYAGAKHALNGFLKGLEFEIGDAVHILTVMPGWIRGTNLRANAFGVAGERTSSPRKHSRESVSVEECSAMILNALSKKRRTLFIPRKLGALKWLQWLAPGLLKVLIRRAVRQQD